VAELDVGICFALEVDAETELMVAVRVVVVVDVVSFFAGFEVDIGLVEILIAVVGASEMFAVNAKNK